MPPLFLRSKSSTSKEARHQKEDEEQEEVDREGGLLFIEWASSKRKDKGESFRIPFKRERSVFSLPDHGGNVANERDL